MLDELKARVCAANLDLVKHGLVKLTWGNVSGLSDDGQFMVIKPSGVSYSTMCAEDMVVVALADGSTAEGKYRPSSDAPTHLALYRAWKGQGVCGIVHTHSTCATAFAQLCRSIECMGTTHADHFHGPVPLTRHLTREEVEGDYEANTGKVILERFANISTQEAPGVLVSGHGPFTWGHTPEEAVINSVALEEIANMARCMLAISAQPVIIPEYIADKHYQRKHGPNAYYGQKAQ